MKEELGFYGNQLVELQSIFTVASVVAQLPFAYLFPKVPLYLLVPSMELLWGVFNLLQYRAHSFGEEVAYRFMVGIFEVRSSTIRAICPPHGCCRLTHDFY